MNLTTFAQLIKRNFGAVLFIAVVSVLVYLIYIRFFPKAEKAELLPLSRQTPVFYPVKVTIFNDRQIESVKVPKTMTVYKKIPETDLLAIETDIQEKFGVKDNRQELENQNGERYISSSGSSGLLTIYSNFISFNRIIRSSEEQTVLTDEQLADKAVDFVKNLNLPITVPEKYHFDYTLFDGEESYIVNEAQSVGWTNVNFTEPLGNYPVISANKTSVSLNKNGEILKADLYPNGQFVSIGDYPIIGLKDALKILKQSGQYPVLATGPGSLLIADPKQRSINQVDIKKAYLGYFDSKDSMESHPVWVFETQGRVQSSAINITYIVFAVNPNFYE